MRYILLTARPLLIPVNLPALDLERLMVVYYHREVDSAHFHRLIQEELHNLPPRSRGSARMFAVRLKFLQGLWELDGENMGEADRYLQEADRETDLWIAEAPSSEAYRYRVEIRTMLMMTRGFFYTLTNALSLQEYADKALNLDPSNPRAQMIIGIKTLYAPFFLGGDPEKGRNDLNQLLNHPRMDRQGKFVAHFEIANSLYREGKKSLAFLELQKAKSYFPESYIAKKLEAEWKKG